MATKLLTFNEGVVVEVGVQRDDNQEMSTSAAERLGRSFDSVGLLIQQVVKPIKDAFVHLHDDLAIPVKIDSAEVELGLSFSAEGNIFVTKATGEASLKITLKFKPK